MDHARQGHQVHLDQDHLGRLREAAVLRQDLTADHLDPDQVRQVPPRGHVLHRAVAAVDPHPGDARPAVLRQLAALRLAAVDGRPPSVLGPKPAALRTRAEPPRTGRKVWCA